MQICISLHSRGVLSAFFCNFVNFISQSGKKYAISPLYTYVHYTVHLRSSSVYFCRYFIILIYNINRKIFFFRLPSRSKEVSGPHCRQRPVHPEESWCKARRAKVQKESQAAPVHRQQQLCLPEQGCLSEGPRQEHWWASILPQADPKSLGL